MNRRGRTRKGGEESAGELRESVAEGGGLFERDENSKAREALLWKLSRRDLSAREAHDWLLSKGYPEAVAAQAVEAAREWRAIDENRLLGAIIRSELRKGRGPAAVRIKLKQRGLAVSEAVWRPIYDSELLEDRERQHSLTAGRPGGDGEEDGEMEAGSDPAQVEAADRERALALVERRYPDFRRDPASRQKAFQFLVRRGFPLSRVSDWLRSG